MEQFLVRAGAAHQDADAASIADDHRAYFQQRETNTVWTGLRQFGVLQGPGAKPLEQGDRLGGRFWAFTN
jgi:hypothetical protein